MKCSNLSPIGGYRHKLSIRRLLFLLSNSFTFMSSCFGTERSYHATDSPKKLASAQVREKLDRVFNSWINRTFDMDWMLNPRLSADGSLRGEAS